MNISELLKEAEQSRSEGNKEKFAAILVEILSGLSETEIVEIINDWISGQPQNAA